MPRDDVTSRRVPDAGGLVAEHDAILLRNGGLSLPRRQWISTARLQKGNFKESPPLEFRYKVDRLGSAKWCVGKLGVAN